MFGELPKLLDRNYAIGFFLPAALIAGILWWVLGLFAIIPPITLETSVDKLIGGALGIGIVWLVSILLMAINYPTLRILQGYGGRRNPLRINLKRAKRTFERRALPALDRQAAYEQAVAAGQARPRLPSSHADDLREAVEHYPDQTSWVLPTRFGNRMRAIEVYARAVYGLDTVPAWPRLQGLLSGEFKELLNASKAQLDFCVNLVAGGVIVAVVLLGLAVYTTQLPGVWPAAAAIVMIVVGYALAIQSMKQYGLYVRSAFDLYRATLATQLGLVMPTEPEREREMWARVSRMFIYRSAPRFQSLAEFRPGGVTPTPSTPNPESLTTSQPAADVNVAEPGRLSALKPWLRRMAGAISRWRRRHFIFPTNSPRSGR